VDPVGFDTEGNTYYLLDDNRLYMRDIPDLPSEKPTTNKKKYRGKKRKRGRIIESEESESPAPVEPNEGSTWHVICVTMDDWTTFISRMKKSRNPDEKALYRHLHENVLPTLLEEEKQRQRQREAKEQEFLREQAYASRKRSTRLVQKEEADKVREENEAQIARAHAEEDEKRREETRVKRLEQEREARLVLREQRQRERELRIQQREEEKKAGEEAEKTGTTIRIVFQGSTSPVPRKTTRQQALSSERGTAEPDIKPEDSWFFDCLCGKHGTNYVTPPLYYAYLG
jgi:hypothetical protein